MFLEQRPQHPASLRPNLALSWQGITTPARPASLTSESVIPLHKQRYMLGLVHGCVSNDYEKHYQYATAPVSCQLGADHYRWLFPRMAAVTKVSPRVARPSLESY